MKEESKNRIFTAILKGGFIHMAGMTVIWAICIVNDTTNMISTLNWYVVLPTLLNVFVFLLLKVLDMYKKKQRITELVYDRIMALMYSLLCCANYVFLRKFDFSFLILVLPVIILLLEHRSIRNIPQVIILLVFYELMQLLPGLLPGEPAITLSLWADMIFGIYISICIMLLLWETKDAYAYSFKKKEESELRLNTYRDFLIKKNQDVRGAVHNVKGTGEMILRNNASPVSAGLIMDVMQACDRIVELVDKILETSRAELFRKNHPSYEHREEEDIPDVSDGTYLYAPGAYILVADDSAEALKLIQVLLARTGMRIDTVKSGSQALKKISYNYYNLIVLDNLLADMSAVQVMRSIKEGNGVNADTPVIVCTTGNREDVRDMYLGEGFAEVVRKPLSGEQIERLTEKFLPSRLVSRKKTGLDDHRPYDALAAGVPEEAGSTSYLEEAI